MLELIVIFAFGSRGDVAPVVSVLKKILDFQDYSGKCLFITHKEHSKLTKFIETTDNLIMHYIDTPCLAFDEADSFEEIQFYSKSYFRTLLKRLASMNCNIKSIITNLFALEGWILSFTFGCRCIIVHPCKPHPIDPPNKEEIKHIMKRTRPHHYSVICAGLNSSDITIINTAVSWEDYAEWLWPSVVAQCYDEVYLALEIFSPQFRQRTIFSHQLRADQANATLFVVPAPTVLIAVSPYLYSAPVDFPANCTICGTICGALSSPPAVEQEQKLIVGTSIATAESSSSLVSSFEVSRATVCVDFGSMTGVIAAKYSLCSFMSALLELADLYQFVVVCHNHWQEISAALRSAMTARNFSATNFIEHATASIQLIDGDSDHSKLFRQCAAVVHHGGVGTVSSCLRAGVPQGSSFIV